MGYKLGKNTTRSLNTLKSKLLIKAVKEFINITPIDFCVLENGGFRTPEEQNALYQKGRTVPGDKVTNCDGYNLKSNHQSGLAVDLVPWVNGKPSWNRDYTAMLAGAFMCFCKSKGYAIRCGADWDSDGILNNNKGDLYDPCHMEEIC